MPPCTLLLFSFTIKPNPPRDGTESGGSFELKMAELPKVESTRILPFYLEFKMAISAERR